MNLIGPEFLYKAKRIKLNKCRYPQCEGCISEFAVNASMALCDTHFAQLNVKEVEVERDDARTMCNDASNTSTRLIRSAHTNIQEKLKQPCNITCKSGGYKDNVSEMQDNGAKSSAISITNTHSYTNAISSNSSREEVLSGLLSTMMERIKCKELKNEELCRRLQKQDSEKYKDVIQFYHDPELKSIMNAATEILRKCLSMQ